MLNRKYLFPISLLLLLCLISGCSTAGSTNETLYVEKSSQLEQTYFPKDSIINVSITIDEADFQAILDDPTAEQYYSADVDYNGKVFSNVGFRTKGNSSLSSVARMSDSDRYSFKLSLDEYVSQNLEGITKINLNNNYSDASYMREFLSYEIASSMGIPTPMYSFVNVYINGELWGLYTAVEQMGAAFIERELDSTDGTLYKSNGGNGADLAALDSFDQYTGLDVKYGEANEEALLHFTDVLNNESEYEDVLDVDSALKFIALNTVLANMDSYASNFKHNYYLYELDGVFSIIPWDMNMSFGGFGGSGILIDEPTGVALSSRPLIAQLIANDTYREKYHEIIEQLLSNYFTNGKFKERVEEIQNMISDSVKADPTAFVTFDEFETGVTSLLSFVDDQTQSITKQLSGEIASAGDGSGSVTSGPGNGGGGFGGGFSGGDRGNRENMNAGEGNTNEAGFTPPDGAQQGQMPEGVTASSDVNQQGQTQDDDTASDGAQQDQMPESFTPPDGMQQGEMPEGFSPPDGAQQSEMPEGFSPPDGAQQGEMPEGFSPPDGMQQGEMPEGFSPPDGMGQGQMPDGATPPDGMNFGDGNFGPNQNGKNSTTPTITTEEKQTHAINTLIAIGILFVSCGIVLGWRRKSL